MISPVGRQCTVCGAVSLVLLMISSGVMTLCIFGRRGSATSTMWIRVEQSGDDEVLPLMFRVAVAAAARVPAEMMQLVVDRRHDDAIDDLRIARRLGIDIDDQRGSRAACGLFAK